MKNIIFFLLLTTSLFSQNPKVFASLGDKIYDNAIKIEKLKSLDSFKIFIYKIDDYVTDVNKTKKLGFLIESGKAENVKKKYLLHLRELAKTNSFFQRTAIEHFEGYMRRGNSSDFNKMLKTGMIDTDQFKDAIRKYYYAHESEVEYVGDVKRFIEEDIKRKERARAEELRRKNALKYKQEQKIKRIRKKDKEKQEEIQKELDKEVKEKKKEIRNYQKEELKIED